MVPHFEERSSQLYPWLIAFTSICFFRGCAPQSVLRTCLYFVIMKPYSLFSYFVSLLHVHLDYTLILSPALGRPNMWSSPVKVDRKVTRPIIKARDRTVSCPTLLSLYVLALGYRPVCCNVNIMFSFYF